MPPSHSCCEWDFLDTHVFMVRELQILSVGKRVGKPRATALLMLALLYIDRSCYPCTFFYSCIRYDNNIFSSHDRIWLIRQKLHTAHLQNFILNLCYCVGGKDHCKGEERSLVRKYGWSRMVRKNTATAIVILFLLFFLREAVCGVTILGQTIVCTVHTQGEKFMRSKIENQLNTLHSKTISIKGFV